MRSTFRAAVVFSILPLAGACGAGILADMPEMLPPPIATAHEMHDIIAPLPTNHIEWEHQLEVSHVHRVTLGVEYLYVEADDGTLFAVNRFTGFVAWVWRHPLGNNASWAPAEVADVIRQRLPLESEEQGLMAQIREIAGRVVPDVKALEPLRKRRAEIGDLLRVYDAVDHLVLVTDNTVHFLERRSGREMWTARLPFMASARPTVSRTTILVPGADPPRVHSLAIEKKGIETSFYRVTMETPDNYVTERPIYQDPNVIFVSHDGTCYAFNVTTGALAWTFQTHDTIRAEPLRYDGVEIRPDPAGGKSQELARSLVVFTALNRNIYAVETSGNVLWKAPMGGFANSGAVACRNAVYVRTENDALLAYDAVPQVFKKDGSFDRIDRNGRLRWRFPLGERFIVALGDGRVLIQGPHHDLVELDEKTGALLHRYPAGPLSYILTNTQDDTLYAVTEAGHLFALRRPPVRD